MILKGQNIEQTFHLANQQYNSGNYRHASKSFQRVIFFDSSGKYIDSSYLRLGQCYLETGKLEKANKNLNLAYHASREDPLKYEVIFRKTVLYLMRRNFNLGLMELYNLPDSLSGESAQRKQFYLGIAHFGLENYQSSKKHFLNSLHDTAAYARKKINVLFAKNKKLRMLNPLTAQILSTVLPGLGQVYAGYFKEGINSFLLTSAFLGLGIHTGLNLSVLDALISVTPWYTRYYLGGFQKSGELVKKRNREKRGKIYKNILEVLARSKS